MKRILPLLLLAALFAAAPASAAPEDDAVIVSKFANSKIYKSDGSTGSFNGETTSDDGLRKVFNGRFDDNIYMNTAKSYILIDLSNEVSNYVTKIVIGHRGNTQYSLYYTEDGTTWPAVVENTTSTDAFTYTVNHRATKVKYVFETTINWTPSLTEIQVWGVDPSALGCLHLEQYLTEWEFVPGTANCTDYGIDQCQCTNCGTWFQRQSAAALPIGHDYETVLVERGTSLTFGNGTNVCKRCGDEIAFPEPRDLTTLGGIAAVGVIQFTDLTVSSTGNPDWGPRPDLLIDNAWAYTWPYWYAASKATSEYVQFDFANDIDLTSVDISVPNRAMTLEFYSVTGDGEELVGERLVEYDSSLGSSGNPNQRITVDFRGVTLKTLRIKSDDSDNALAIYECHPYGTVNGAGKSAAVRTRIIID
ncbi:MAG: hypothetical protein IJV65_07190 [Kiritimatiellae bacterium]|nr:hypothetical protein [Kiritimatiellia bacterium]